jgi:DNA-binding transcriptional LysR family regulator
MGETLVTAPPSVQRILGMSFICVGDKSPIHRAQFAIMRRNDSTAKEGRTLMDLRHLKHIVALADEGTFTAAAARVHIVQSAFSVSIKELEDELGVQLVERTTRRTALTPAGEMFVAKARATLVQLDDAVQAVRAFRGVVQGRLRIGILQSLAPYVRLPELLESMRSRYPGIEFTVRSLSTRQGPALVASGDIDLSFHPHHVEEKMRGVEVTPFVEDALVVVCATSHPLAGRREIRLDRLSEQRLVHLSPERTLRRVTDRMLAEHGLVSEVVYEVNDVETMLQFVASGLGVAVVPSKLASYSTHGNALRSLRLVAPGATLPKWRVAILTRERSPGSEAGLRMAKDIFLAEVARFLRK